MNDDTEKPSLNCFLNDVRVCGPSCMAYNTQVTREQDYVGQQWPSCHLLINAHRLGKHAVIIASALVKMAPKPTPPPQPEPPTPR